MTVSRHKQEGIIRNFSVTLKPRFIDLLSELSSDNNHITTLWHNIYSHYNQPHRHYHTLTHLNHMFVLMDEYQSKLHNTTAVQLAIWYHDIIYNPKSSDNEQQSANYFVSEYLENLPTLLVDEVTSLILMTASHEFDNNTYRDTYCHFQNLAHSNLNNSHLCDAKYFLDMDLAILGSSWNSYEKYVKKVRLEYQHLSDAEFKAGRKTVLKKFLNKQTLYFTSIFKQRFEMQARNNLKREIEQEIDYC